MAVVYMAATMGFGVHVCRYDGSAEALLFMGSSCCVHSHTQVQNPCQHHNQFQNHCPSLPDSLASEACTACDAEHCGVQEGCCEVLVYALGADQYLVSKVSLSAPFMAYLADLPDEMSSLFSGPQAEAIYWSDPPPLLAHTAFLLPLRL